MEKKKPKKAAGKDAKKRGRGSKYHQLGISQKLKSIEGWARHGSTNAEIAEMLGVSEATLYRWKGLYPELREALRVGAREANGEVLNSAFQQSVGYYALQREAMKLKKVAARENAEGIIEIVKDAKGNPVLEEVAEIVEYMKFFEPDARMTMFMLINRLREFYQSKVTADINGELKTGMTEDEIKLLEKVWERLEKD